MKSNKKKGFTLVELLGVIVILLLLALIVTPIFVNYIKKSKNDAYDSQINTIKQSAKNWASAKENIKLLPTKDGDCISVTLERLKDDGYVDYNLKNPNTNTLFSDDLKVVIRKDGKKITYEIDEQGTAVCSIITSEYPKWILDSASPAKVSKTDTANVVIKSDKKIINQQLTAEKIIVKVGGKTISDANVDVNCSNEEILTCNLTITNLSGSGKLSLVIDKETMQDEDGNYSKKQNILPNIMVDCKGPIITYISKTNTNKRAKYATKDDTVKIKFKAEDNEVISNLTVEDILVYIEGVQVNVPTKTLTSKNSTGKVEYTLTLKGITATGNLSINVPAGKIEDDLGNKNQQTAINPGVTYDNIMPNISLNPDERSQYLSNINVLVKAYDNETGIDEETLKYSFTKEPQNATATKKIANGTIVNRDGNKDQKEIWYIVANVCDLAGNCITNNVQGGPYNLSRKGPEISITPQGVSPHVKSQNITIKVTSTGIDLDETSFKYTEYSEEIAYTDKSPQVDKIFQNNKAVKLSGLNGKYYIVAEACDVQGNCTRKNAGPYLFDNESPVISCKPQNQTTTVISPYPVSVYVGDNGIGLNSTNVPKYRVYPSGNQNGNYTNFSINNNRVNSWVYINGNTTKTEKYFIEVKACDKLSNCKTTSCGYYRVDAVKPTIDEIAVNGTKATTTIRDDNWLGGYKVTTTKTTPTSGWIEVNGTKSNVEYNAMSSGTYYLHVKDYVGNTAYKKFTITMPSTEKEQVIVSDDVTTCTQQVYSFTAQYTGYYQVTMQSARSEDGVYQPIIDTGNGYSPANYDNDRDSANYSRPTETYGNTASATFYFTAGQKLNYTLGCSGEDGVTHVSMSNEKSYTPGVGGWPDGVAGASGTGASGSAGSVRLYKDNGTTVMRVAGGAGGIRINQLPAANFAATLPVSTVTGKADYINGSLDVNLNNVTDRKVGWIKIEYVGDSLSSIPTTVEFKDINGTSVFVAPRSGYYKLEVWGAQGGQDYFTDGGSYKTADGGKGGYATRTIELVEGVALYVTVGSMPSRSFNYQEKANESETKASAPGGYNGGGSGSNGGASGGGATHIATSYRGTGLLKDYVNYKDELLVVAGGGGGGKYSVHDDGRVSVSCPGGAGGGTTGQDGFKNDLLNGDAHCYTGVSYHGKGGTSTGSPRNTDGGSAGGFGYGGSGSQNGSGGAGYYGGSAGEARSTGGGGSSYVNGGNNHNGSTMANVNSGHGKAKITYCGPVEGSC